MNFKSKESKLTPLQQVKEFRNYHGQILTYVPTKEASLERGWRGRQNPGARSPLLGVLIPHPCVGGVGKDSELMGMELPFAEEESDR